MKQGLSGIWGKRLTGDTFQEANSSEIKALRNENEELKPLVAELSVERLLRASSLKLTHSTSS